MATTSLPFYRKNQSLHDMEKERPKHMAALREAVCNAASEVEANLKVIEREFNGGRRHEDEIRHVLPAVKHVMDTFEYTYINSAHNLEDLLDLTLEPSEVFRFDMLAASIVKDYHRKLVDFLPERFETIIEDLKRILLHLDMYCLSFCPPHIMKNQDSIKKKNVYLETPIHYSLKRQDYAKTIQMHINNIENMSQAYRQPEGVMVKAFGLTTNELARRCDCGEVPFLLIFPEACFNVKYACAGIRKWIEADKEYTDFVRCDIERMEFRKLEQSKIMQDGRVSLAGITSQSRATRKTISQLETEMANMAKSEKRVLDEIAKLEMDIKVMNIELEYQERERDRIREESANNPEVSEAEVVEKLDAISKIVANIRLDIPETKNKILIVKNKQKIVINKRDLLNQKIAEYDEFDKQKIMARGHQHEIKREFEKVDSALLILKDIYMKRTSPDLTKKIFNSMPVQPRNLRHMPKRPAALRQKRDPLDRASKIVSKNISNGWTDLYRNLPFYPERGVEEKDHDLDITNKRHYREEDQHKASESIERWRTHNAVANVNSLKDTLAKMGRNDIVDKIDRKPKKPEKPPKAKATANWKKLKKLKGTLGRILAMQKETHKSKLAMTIGDRLSNGDENTHTNAQTTSRSVKKGLLTGRSISNQNTSRSKVTFSLPKIKAY